MSIVGGTFVGGSSTGWAIVDPFANAAALGMTATPQITTPVLGGGAAAPAAPAPAYNPYAANGTVGGSWSPEPLGNNQILYGHYSATGAVALPQALYGQQATTAAPASYGQQQSAAPAAPAAPPAPPVTGGGSQPSANGGAKPKADAPAKSPKPAAKPEPKPLTVKEGDSLSRLAADHGTTWQKLYELNKDLIGPNPNLIRPGQQLKLP